MFNIYQLIGLFVIYAFLGWCVEVAFVAVTSGSVVNRGFLNGPVCPIYGFGMLAVLLVLIPIQENLLILFLGGMLLTSAIELVGGWALNKLFQTRWWDYTDEPFNLGGYVCLRFSIMWGLGTMVMVRLIHPALYRVFLAVPYRVGLALEVCACLLLAVDLTATVITVTGLNRDLKELNEVALALHKGSDLLTQRVGNAALKADNRIDEGRLEFVLAKAEASDRLEESREEWERLKASSKEDLEAYLTELEARRDALRDKMLGHRTFGAARLLRAFPRMKQINRQEQLESLQQELRSRMAALKEKHNGGKTA